MSREELENSITRDDFHHHGTLPNNFAQTLPAADQAYRAISTFKDEYLLDFINVEELGIRDRQDLDEQVVENAIIHNVKNFILTFGKDFAFIRNAFRTSRLPYTVLYSVPKGKPLLYWRPACMKNR